jgi:invasion protein IalB
MSSIALIKTITRLFGVSLIALASVSAQANENAQQTEPKLTQTQHGDWVLLCSENAEQNRCQMQQTLSVQQGEQSQRVLQAIVTRQGDQRLLEIIVPLGIDLRPGLLIQVDENPVGAMPYLTCNAAGCITLINLDDAVWQQLRVGQKAKMGIRGVGQAENTVLELSLKGFTAASNALMAK